MAHVVTLRLSELQNNSECVTDKLCGRVCYLVALWSDGHEQIWPLWSPQFAEIKILNNKKASSKNLYPIKQIVLAYHVELLRCSKRRSWLLRHRVINISQVTTRMANNNSLPCWWWFEHSIVVSVTSTP